MHDESCNMQENYVNMQNNNVCMQDQYVGMQVINLYREYDFYIGKITYFLSYLTSSMKDTT